MSYQIQVFCERCKKDILSEIDNFIEEGGYFENAKVEFLSSSNSTEQVSGEAVKIIYEHDKSPIIIHSILDSEGIAKESKELIFVLNLSKKSSVQKDITDKILKASQVFILDFEKELISDDCWEMLDAIESFLANVCDGIVYSPDDGFFNKALNHLYSL
jgi:uncharacterized membrane protein YheB (UPF0754 family)